MPKSRVVLEHPPPSWSRIWLTKLIVALWAFSLPTALEAQSLLGANRVAEPQKPAGFPAIDTLIERTGKLAPERWRTQNRRSRRPVEGLALPELGKNASQVMVVFDRSAVKAIRATHEDDHDDPAVLLSLRAKLEREEALEPARLAWDPLLDRALTRARALESIRGPLHGLRRAFRQTHFDDYSGVYRELDISTCLRASAKALSTLGEGTDLSITLAPVGYQRISTFRTLCEQALHLELVERRFPKTLGEDGPRAEVAKAYRRFAPDEQVLKISAPQGWVQSDSHELLEAEVGVEFSSAEHGFRCAIIRVTLSRASSPLSAQPPTCCDVQKAIPINCKELRQ